MSIQNAAHAKRLRSGSMTTVSLTMTDIIVENNPTKEELRDWLSRSDKPVRKFFNTSGMLYREWS